MPVKMDTQVEAAGRDTQREAISSDSSRTGEGQGKVVYVSIRFIFFYVCLVCGVWILVLMLYNVLILFTFFG